MSALEARLKKLEFKRANRGRKYLSYVFVNAGETQLEAAQKRGFDESHMDKIFFVRFLRPGEEHLNATPPPPVVEYRGYIPNPGPPEEPTLPPDDEEIAAPVDANLTFWERRIRLIKEGF